MLVKKGLVLILLLISFRLIVDIYHKIKLYKEYAPKGISLVVRLPLTLIQLKLEVSSWMVQMVLQFAPGVSWVGQFIFRNPRPQMNVAAFVLNEYQKGFDRYCSELPNDLDELSDLFIALDPSVQIAILCAIPTLISIVILAICHPKKFFSDKEKQVSTVTTADELQEQKIDSMVENIEIPNRPKVFDCNDLRRYRIKSKAKSKKSSKLADLEIPPWNHTTKVTKKKYKPPPPVKISKPPARKSKTDTCMSQYSSTVKNDGKNIVSEEENNWLLLRNKMVAPDLPKDVPTIPGFVVSKAPVEDIIEDSCEKLTEKNNLFFQLESKRSQTNISQQFENKVPDHDVCDSDEFYEDSLATMIYEAPAVEMADQSSIDTAQEIPAIKIQEKTPQELALEMLYDYYPLPVTKPPKKTRRNPKETIKKEGKAAQNSRPKDQQRSEKKQAELSKPDDAVKPSLDALLGRKSNIFEDKSSNQKMKEKNKHSPRHKKRRRDTAGSSEDGAFNTIPLPRIQNEVSKTASELLAHLLGEYTSSKQETFSKKTKKSEEKKQLSESEMSFIKDLLLESEKEQCKKTTTKGDSKKLSYTQSEKDIIQSLMDNGGFMEETENTWKPEQTLPTLNQEPTSHAEKPQQSIPNKVNTEDKAKTNRTISQDKNRTISQTKNRTISQTKNKVTRRKPWTPYKTTNEDSSLKRNTSEGLRTENQNTSPSLCNNNHSNVTQEDRFERFHRFERFPSLFGDNNHSNVSREDSVSDVSVDFSDDVVPQPPISHSVPNIPHAEEKLLVCSKNSKVKKRKKSRAENKVESNRSKARRDIAEESPHRDPRRTAADQIAEDDLVTAHDTDADDHSPVRRHTPLNVTRQPRVQSVESERKTSGKRAGSVGFFNYVSSVQGAVKRFMFGNPNSPDPDVSPVTSQVARQPEQQSSYSKADKEEYAKRLLISKCRKEGTGIIDKDFKLRRKLSSEKKENVSTKAERTNREDSAAARGSKDRRDQDPRRPYITIPNCRTYRQSRDHTHHPVAQQTSDSNPWPFMDSSKGKTNQGITLNDIVADCEKRSEMNAEDLIKLIKNRRENDGIFQRHGNREDRDVATPFKISYDFDEPRKYQSIEEFPDFDEPRKYQSIEDFPELENMVQDILVATKKCKKKKSGKKVEFKETRDYTAEPIESLQPIESTPTEPVKQAEQPNNVKQRPETPTGSKQSSSHTVTAPRYRDVIEPIELKGEESCKATEVQHESSPALVDKKIIKAAVNKVTYKELKTNVECMDRFVCKLPEVVKQDETVTATKQISVESMGSSSNCSTLKKDSLLTFFKWHAESLRKNSKQQNARVNFEEEGFDKQDFSTTEQIVEKYLHRKNKVSSEKSSNMTDKLKFPYSNKSLAVIDSNPQTCDRQASVRKIVKDNECVVKSQTDSDRQTRQKKSKEAIMLKINKLLKSDILQETKTRKLQKQLEKSAEIDTKIKAESNKEEKDGKSDVAQTSSFKESPSNDVSGSPQQLAIWENMVEKYKSSKSNSRKSSARSLKIDSRKSSARSLKSDSRKSSARSLKSDSRKSSVKSFRNDSRKSSGSSLNIDSWKKHVYSDSETEVDEVFENPSKTSEINSDLETSTPPFIHTLFPGQFKTESIRSLLLTATPDESHSNSGCKKEPGAEKSECLSSVSWEIMDEESKKKQGSSKKPVRNQSPSAGAGDKKQPAIKAGDTKQQSKPSKSYTKVPKKLKIETTSDKTLLSKKKKEKKAEKKEVLSKSAKEDSRKSSTVKEKAAKKNDIGSNFVFAGKEVEERRQLLQNYKTRKEMIKKMDAEARERMKSKSKKPTEAVEEKTAVEKTEIEKIVPEKVVLEKKVPKKTVPEKVVPEKTVPEKTVQQKTVPVKKGHEKTVSKKAVQEKIVPEKTVPEKIVSEKRVSEKKTAKVPYSVMDKSVETLEKSKQTVESFKHRKELLKKLEEKTKKIRLATVAKKLEKEKEKEAMKIQCDTVPKQKEALKEDLSSASSEDLLNTADVKQDDSNTEEQTDDTQQKKYGIAASLKKRGISSPVALKAAGKNNKKSEATEQTDENCSKTPVNQTAGKDEHQPGKKGAEEMKNEKVNNIRPSEQNTEVKTATQKGMQGVVKKKTKDMKTVQNKNDSESENPNKKDETVCKQVKSESESKSWNETRPGTKSTIETKNSAGFHIKLNYEEKPGAVTGNDFEMQSMQLPFTNSKQYRDEKLWAVSSSSSSDQSITNEELFASSQFEEDSDDPDTFDNTNSNQQDNDPFHSAPVSTPLSAAEFSSNSNHHLSSYSNQELSDNSSCFTKCLYNPFSGGSLPRNASDGQSLKSASSGSTVNSDESTPSLKGYFKLAPARFVPPKSNN